MQLWTVPKWLLTRPESHQAIGIAGVNIWRCIQVCDIPPDPHGEPMYGKAARLRHNSLCSNMFDDQRYSFGHVQNTNCQKMLFQEQSGLEGQDVNMHETQIARKHFWGTGLFKGAGCDRVSHHISDAEGYNSDTATWAIGSAIA